MNQLSEGTLRFLWLATLLQNPGLTGLVLIDEPEVSLHPELLSLLAELMREASVECSWSSPHTRIDSCDSSSRGKSSPSMWMKMDRFKPEGRSTRHRRVAQGVHAR